MIGRPEQLHRRWRRRPSGSELAASLLGLSRAQGTGNAPARAFLGRLPTAEDPQPAT